jgi:hypothetical protein
MPLASFKPSHPLLCFFLQHLSWGSADTPVLQAEVTWAWEAVIAVGAACVTMIHAAETTAQEAVAAWDSTAIHAKDVEDRATIVEREAQELVLRVEAENTAVLACAHEDE